MKSICVFIVSAIVGFLVTSLWSMSRSNRLPFVVHEIDAYEERGYRFCYDPLICIRDVGEELGIDNQLIMTMIRIARSESKCDTKTNANCIPDNGVSGPGFDPYAKNPKSTATGIFQILLGTWEDSGCTGSRTDFEDNIRCGYRVLARQGLGAWNASREVWDR